MNTEPPLRVGDRVRLRPGCRPTARYRTGTVVKVSREECTRGPFWVFRIRRDGTSPNTGDVEYPVYERLPDRPAQWERVPLRDLTADETAQALADAVKAGNTEAALGLADHVFELYGGHAP